MIIDDVPFWNLLIYIMLPVVIAVILFIRSISIFKEVLDRFNTKEIDVFMDMGNLLLYITALSVIIGLVYLLVVEDLDGGAIFQFLVMDMLPITVYIILLYGIMFELKLLFSR